jgi:ribosome biogenesis GTPase
MNQDSSQYLLQLGWDSFFEKQFQAVKVTGSIPARVVSESKGSFQVSSEYGELTAKISGKMRYRASEENQYPAVGDWVVIKPLINEQKGIINAVLPRKIPFLL